MANTTVTNLPTVTALNGSEPLLGVQSGTSVQITTGQIASLANGAGGLPFDVSIGGTGRSSFTQHGIVLGNGTSPLTQVAVGLSNQILVGVTGGAPVWSSSVPSTAAVTSIDFGSTGLTPNLPSTGAIAVGGTLVAGSGGTGISSYTIGDLLYASGTSALSKRAAVAVGSVLISNGVGAAPIYSDAPTLTTSLTVPTIYGGTGVASSLTLQSTTGVGATDLINFKVGNNGATTAMTIINSGNVGIGINPPTRKLDVVGGIVRIGNASATTFRIDLGTTGVGTDRSAYIDGDGTNVFIMNQENGALKLGTNNNNRFQIGSAGQWGIGGATYGTAGQAFISGGNAAAPSWGTLGPSGGGTGLTSFTSGGAMYATSTSTLTTGTLPVASGGTGATTANAGLSNLTTWTTTATAGGTTTLTNTSTYFQYFTGTLAQTITLPVTSTLSTGWSYHIVNNSTGNLTVNSSGGNLVVTVLSGVTAMVTCIGTTLTTAADWEAGYTDFSTATGTGSVVLSASPTLTGTTTATTVSATTLTATAGAGFQNMVVQTSGTSYSLPAALQVTGAKFKVTIVGGGAGGAGCAAAATFGGGGGGGATVVTYLTYVAGQNTLTYSIGASAAGGTGAATGTAGNASSATYNALTYTAGGGSGGTAAGAGGAGGTGSGTAGTLTIVGQAGGAGGTTTITAGQTSLNNSGGSSGLGFGYGGFLTFASGGGAGTGGQAYGGGGSGAMGGNAATSRNGGAGSAGVVIIEY